MGGREGPDLLLTRTCQEMSAFEDPVCVGEVDESVRTSMEETLPDHPNLLTNQPSHFESSIWVSELLNVCSEMVSVSQNRRIYRIECGRL